MLPNGSYYLPLTDEIIPADMATPSPDDRPDAGQTQTNGTLRIGGPGRFPPFEADFSV